jgi:type VI secretion system protein ImpE
LGPLLEAIVNGRYYWIPFARLRELRIEKPCDLRDIAWTPAHITLENGGDTVALIPTRYPGTERAPDPRLIMARGTEWLERPGSTFLGVGQRLFATDQGEHGLMDVRVIEFEGTGEAAGEPPEQQRRDGDAPA